MAVKSIYKELKRTGHSVPVVMKNIKRNVYPHIYSTFYAS